MTDPKTIKQAFEHNKKAIELRPSIGQSTARTTIRVRNGTTCEIKSGSKKLVCDVGTDAGGNDAGPGPGILERAALGSCLAMGYVQMAMVMEIAVEKIEVETDFDARGMFGIEERPPGFSAVRYAVYIESPASEAEIQKVIDAGDKHIPVLDDFKRPIPVQGEVNIKSTKVKTS